MAHFGNDGPDDLSVGSGTVSPANGNTLTGDKLRRRPAHSRKASVESLDLEDTLLPAALERLQIYASSGSGGERPPRRVPSFEKQFGRESVASVTAAHGAGFEEGFEVTSAEKPAMNRGGSVAKIRAVVASGGTLVDASDGSNTTYKGGDTRLVSISRGVSFTNFVELLALSLASAKLHRIIYRDPNDANALIRVTNDADIDELFQEWDRYVEGLMTGGVPAAKLKVYVVEKGGSNDSARSEFGNETPRGNDSADRNATESFGKAVGSLKTPRESASKSSGLQAVPSSELTLVHRLGGGAFGEVHLALWRGSEVAVKFLHHTTTTRAPRRRSVPDAAASDVGGGVFGERDGRDVAKNDVLGSNPETEHDGCSVSSSDDEREEEAQIQEEMHARLSFLKEAKVMAALHHPNVVFVYGVVDDSGKLGIVEEFMRSGSLRRLLNLHVREQAEMKTIAEDAGEGGVSKEEKPSSDPPSVKKKKSSGKRFLSATTRAKCALDIARGMAYLHSRRFVHFDLKCDNVLTARQLGIAGGVTCKVADFGLSKQQKGTAVGVSLGGSSSLTAGNNAGGHNPGHGSRNPQGHREFTSGIASQRGTLPWTAPELFSDPQSATEKVDVYSFGVTMWELWTCDVPFKDLREQSVVWGIMTGKRPELSDTAKEPFAGYKTLMKSCWSEDVQKRPNFDDVVAQLEVATNSNEGLSKS